MEAALHLKGLEFTGRDFEVYSSVPVGVGLGSCTAAVLAGLIAADRLDVLGLNQKTLFDFARIYESRLDNLYAAWHGGFVACAGTQCPSILRRPFVPGDFVLTVVTPESNPALPLTDPQRPSKLVGPDQPLSLERAQMLADLFMQLGNKTAPDLQAAVPPGSEKCVPGLKEVLDVRVDGVMGVFVCRSGPAVAILSCRNSLELYDSLSWILRSRRLTAY